ncbi:hypothetical protein HT576_10965 [Haloterrigena sp. SYSU A121-1]|uniref:Uncharacterized protein n=1 Tax=Haloterrigena gelatinilytica TaxID=2741724 RepID=A0A8J8GQ78_9EURY|nr:hypothetical protein [Haloterrigena gelatinilytica]NUB91535.1 hypothetical protein [Haloterrigena gelatinilytica]
MTAREVVASAASESVGERVTIFRCYDSKCSSFALSKTAYFGTFAARIALGRCANISAEFIAIEVDTTIWSRRLDAIRSFLSAYT